MAAYTNNKAGPPISGRYAVGDTVTDANGVVWECVIGGQAGFLGMSDAIFAASAARESVQMTIPVTGAKAGATAGWTIAAGADTAFASLPQSQTSSTLILPLTGLNVGDVITGVAPIGQIESAGGNVTLAMAVHKQTAAAADHTDAAIATGTTGVVAADAVLSGSTGGNSSISETVAAGETFYAKFTGTTAASTDVQLSGVVVTVTRAAGT